MRNGLRGAVEAPPRRTKQRPFSYGGRKGGRRESRAKRNQMEEVCVHGVRYAEEERGTKAPCTPIVFPFIWRKLLPGPVGTAFEALDYR